MQQHMFALISRKVYDCASTVTLVVELAEIAMVSAGIQYDTALRVLNRMVNTGLLLRRDDGLCAHPSATYYWVKSSLVL